MVRNARILRLGPFPLISLYTGTYLSFSITQQDMFERQCCRFPDLSRLCGCRSSSESDVDLILTLVSHQKLHVIPIPSERSPTSSDQLPRRQRPAFGRAHGYWLARSLWPKQRASFHSNKVYLATTGDRSFGDVSTE